MAIINSGDEVILELPQIYNYNNKYDDLASTISKSKILP